MARKQPTTPAEQPATKSVSPDTPFDPYEEESREQDEAAAQKGTEQPGAAPAPAASTSAASPPPAETPAVHKHSKRLTKEALDWGFTQSQIDSMTSEELDDALYERQRAQRLANERQQRPEPKPEPRKEPEEPDFELPPEAADYDEPTKKVLKAIGQKALKETAELKKQLAEFKEWQQRETQRAEAERLDRAFGKHAEVFGDKPMSELSADSVEAQRRQHVLGALLNRARAGETFDLAAEIAKSARLFGAVPKPEPKAAEKPAKAPAEPEVEDVDPAQLELEERKKQWAEGGVAKPTARSEDIPPGPKRAWQTLSRLMKGQEQSDDEFLNAIGHKPRAS